MSLIICVPAGWGGLYGLVTVSDILIEVTRLLVVLVLLRLLAEILLPVAFLHWVDMEVDQGNYATDNQNR